MHILKKKLVRIESSADSFLLVGQQVSLFSLCFMFGMKKKTCQKTGNIEKGAYDIHDQAESKRR